MRICCACGIPKDDTAFNWRNKVKGLRQAHCRACQKLRGAAHYRDHKEAFRQRNRTRKSDRQALFYQWLLTKKCVDCGETDPVVLDCDHVRGTKVQSVSRLLLDGRSWHAIFSEIEKCEVRCANCHRRKTAREGGWYRLLE